MSICSVCRREIMYGQPITFVNPDPADDSGACRGYVHKACIEYQNEGDEHSPRAIRRCGDPGER